MVASNAGQPFMWESAQAAIAKYHSLELNSRHLFSHILGGQKFATKILEGLGFFQGLFRWLVEGHLFPVPSRGPSSVYTRVCVQIFSYKDTGHIELESILKTSVLL